MERIAKDSRVATVEARLKALLLQGLDGEASAYRSFLAELGAYLRGFFRKKLFGLPDEVEDLVQETLLAIHSQRHTYRIGQPLTAWVHAIARYKLADLLRSHYGRERLHDPLDDEMQLFAINDIDAADAKRDLHALLDTLPERQRALIVHMKLEGLSVRETSRVTGVSESAVKVGVHRALKTLAAKIKEET